MGRGEAGLRKRGSCPQGEGGRAAQQTNPRMKMKESVGRAFGGLSSRGRHRLPSLATLALSGGGLHQSQVLLRSRGRGAGGVRPPLQTAAMPRNPGIAPTAAATTGSTRSQQQQQPPGAVESNAARLRS